MSEENTNTESESANKPLASEGDIAVWPKQMPSGDEVFVISNGPKGNRSYATLYPQVGGATLSADEALALYMGYDIEKEMVSKAGNPYKAMLALEGIVNTTNTGKDGRKYTNTTARVGMAMCRTTKEDGELYGYRIKQDNRFIDFFKDVGPKDGRQVELSARACFQLLNNEVIEEDGIQMSLGEITSVNKDGKEFHTARVWCKDLTQAQTQDAPAEEVNAGQSV